VSDTRKDHEDEQASTKDGPHGDQVVRAEPGSAAETKTGDSAAVDTRGGVVGTSFYDPASADEANREHRVSDTDPNYLEAVRKEEGGQERLDAEAAGRAEGDRSFGQVGPQAGKTGSDRSGNDHTTKRDDSKAGPGKSGSDE
jgi:hypothetical protein